MLKKLRDDFAGELSSLTFSAFQEGYSFSSKEDPKRDSDEKSDSGSRDLTDFPGLCLRDGWPSPFARQVLRHYEPVDVSSSIRLMCCSFIQPVLTPDCGKSCGICGRTSRTGVSSSISTPLK